MISMPDQDVEIDLIIRSLKKNSPNILSKISNLDKVMTVKLENILLDLIQVKKIFHRHSLDFRDILSFEVDVRNIIQKRGKITPVNVMLAKLQKIILTLNSLKRTKDIETVGKGMEVTVKGIPSYYLADKVVKRLFETTDKGIVDDYLMRVTTYTNRMNSIHPNFRLWPSEFKVIKKDIYFGTNNSEVYIVYSIQKRFHPGFILKNYLGTCSEEKFLEIASTIFEITLKMLESNLTSNAKVSGDIYCGNIVYINDMFFYFDYNNPFLKIGNEQQNKEMKKVWDLIKKGQMLGTVEKIGFFPFVNSSFIAEYTIEKLSNSVFFSYKHPTPLLKEKMLAILKAKSEKINVGLNLRRISVSRITHMFKHGAVLESIPSFMKKQ